MKKLLGAAVVVLALSGCGGPLEDGTDATGATRQEVGKADSPPMAPTVNVIDTSLLRSPQENLVLIPAFQERQHLTNPIHRGDCP